jgi:hypothetical protein
VRILLTYVVVKMLAAVGSNLQVKNNFGPVLLPGFRAVFAKTGVRTYKLLWTKTSLRENGPKTGQKNGPKVCGLTEAFNKPNFGVESAFFLEVSGRGMGRYSSRYLIIHMEGTKILVVNFAVRCCTG